MLTCRFKLHFHEHEFNHCYQDSLGKAKLVVNAYTVLARYCCYILELFFYFASYFSILVLAILNNILSFVFNFLYLILYL